MFLKNHFAPPDSRCICKVGYAGVDCMQDVSLGYWTAITPEFTLPMGSASHRSIFKK